MPPQRSAGVLRQLIDARRVAMTGQAEVALRRISAAVSELNGPDQQDDAVALLNLNAEILALSYRADEALLVFDKEIEGRLARCSADTRLVTADNRSVLLQESLILEDSKVDQFYYQVDARRLAQFELWDAKAFASAQQDAESGRHLDALQELWGELVRAHRRGSWRAMRVVASDLAKHWLLAKEPASAVFYAILGQDEHLVEQVSLSLIGTRQSQVIAAAADRVLKTANMPVHAKTGAQMIAKLADSLPADRLPQVFGWLMTTCTRVPTSRGEAGAIEMAWNAIGHLCNRLDENQADQVVGAATQHPCWQTAGPCRRTLVRVVDGLLSRLTPARLSLVVGAALPLADELSHEVDYTDVLSLLVHAANFNRPDIRNCIRQALFQPGRRVQNFRLAAAAAHFDASLDANGLHGLVGGLVKDIRNQVQCVAEGEIPEPISTGSFGTVHTTGPGRAPTVQVLGGSPGLDVILAHKAKVSDEDRQDLVRVCLRMVAEPANLIVNKIMLVQTVGELADCVGAALAVEVSETLIPLSKGASTEPDVWQSFLVSRRPLSRFKVDMGSPFELQGAALHALSKLVSSHPELDVAQAWQLLLEGAAHVSVEVRKPAMVGLGKLKDPPGGAIATLLMGTRDEDVEVAQIAYLVLSERHDLSLDITHWHALLHSAARTLQREDRQLRRAVALAVGRLLPRAPSGAIADALREMQTVMTEDLSFLVRSAAAGNWT